LLGDAASTTCVWGKRVAR